ncbi:MAG TPA: ChaN family lipoprotein [Phnomibacter sp.]|nr:ChaN family lipoprotein [Phnomibacter sp.]
MKNSFLLLLLFSCLIAIGQNKPAYQLYTAKGKKTDFGKMLKAMQQKEVVLFGEYHDNAIAHWLQLELTREMGNTQTITLGAEMFEADNQQALNNYLSGKITAKGLDSTARLWPNYSTDYAPLVKYAKEKNYAFIATNIPRRYASMVAKGGLEVLDTLSALEKTWMMPLPVAYDSLLPCYKNMIAAMGGHGGANLPKAQAVKDATMANFILKNLQPGVPFIHYNGSYHSDNYESINWYLQKGKPGISIGTISTVSQKDVSKLEKENLGKADFILVVDEDMTKTY